MLLGVCHLYLRVAIPSSQPLRDKTFYVGSLSTGEIHPRAEHIGIFSATSTWRYRIGSMRVSGDNFAVASEQGLYISVWNWKSGKHISDFVRSLFKWKDLPSPDHQPDGISTGIRLYLP